VVTGNAVELDKRKAIGLIRLEVIL
jgi:hypothetical protein